MKNNLKSYSLTCSKELLRLVLAIVLSYGCKCNTIDIQAAFLQESNIVGELFLKPLKEYYKGQF